MAYDLIAATPERLFDTATLPRNCKLTGIEETIGGCGANIAYNCVLQGASPSLVAATGRQDDERIIDALHHMGVARDYLLREDGPSARALIVTDAIAEQFTAFFPGPLNAPGPDDVARWRDHVRSALHAGTRVFIQAPLSPPLLMAGLEAARAASWRGHIWCNPGQFAYQLDGEEISRIVELADFVVGNRHEIDALQIEANHPQTILIATDGAQPIRVCLPDRTFHIPLATAEAVDPTGCGDAFLAALAVEFESVRKQPGDPDATLRAAIDAGIRLARKCLSQVGATSHSAADRRPHRPTTT